MVYEFVVQILWHLLDQTPTVGEQEMSESIDGEESPAGLNMGDQNGLASSLSREAKSDL